MFRRVFFLYFLFSYIYCSVFSPVWRTARPSLPSIISHILTSPWLARCPGSLCWTRLSPCSTGTSHTHQVKPSGDERVSPHPCQAITHARFLPKPISKRLSRVDSSAMFCGGGGTEDGWPWAGARHSCGATEPTRVEVKPATRRT